MNWTKPWRWGLAAVAAGILVLAACDGTNLFDQDQNPFVEPRVNINAPDTAYTGTTINVVFGAAAPMDVNRIDVSVAGAITIDSTFSPSPADSVNATLAIAVPPTVTVPMLIITAQAYDRQSRASRVRQDTVFIAAAVDTTTPTVTATAPAASAAGLVLPIRLVASDNVNLAQIGFAAVNPAGDTIGVTPTMFATAGLTKDTTVNFTVPANITPRTIRIFGLAVDATGRRGISAPDPVIIADSAAPLLTINAPVASSTVPLRDSVRVNFRVVDASGVREVRLQGLATRRDSLGPTVVATRFEEKTVTFDAPLTRDTVITRYLRATSDTTSEPVEIILTALDSIGNESTAIQTVFVGGPRVDLRNPVNNSQVVIGGNLLISAFAVDVTGGIDSVKVQVRGVQTADYSFRPNSPDSVLINQNYTVGAATGALTITAQAWNRNRIGGTSNPVTVTVTAVAPADTAKPALSVSVLNPPSSRVELDDSITVTVRAGDVGTSGLTRIGIAMIALPDTNSVAQDTVYRYVNFPTAQTGTIDQTFKVRLLDFLEADGTPRYSTTDNLRFPRQFTLLTHAFAVDASGNCGASVTTTTASLTCVNAPQDGNANLALNQPGQQIVVTATAGSSVRLPSGGSIADALVDTDRQRLYLSNITQSKLEVFDIAADSFISTGALAGRKGLVGSAPWGMSLTPDRNTLVVANSGSTTVSKVHLGPFANPASDPNDMVEDLTRRVFTPNTVLFNLLLAVNNGWARFTVDANDFSDRPQFTAVDMDTLLLYSTTPTGSAPDGTIRFVDADPDPLSTTDRPEVKLLFNSGAVRPVADSYALANIDSIKIVAGGPNAHDAIVLYDHQSGYPAIVVQAFGANPDSMVQAMRAAGSDAFIGAGQWWVDKVGMSDTTFVAISPNREVVGFGEGAVEPTGRVILCCTKTRGITGLEIAISAEVAVADLINNASERVMGLGLGDPDASGTVLGVARGSQSTYFFDRDLRLQGLFSQGVAGGSGGAALHPFQTGRLEPTQNEALAFVATANRTIKIIDTVHFYQRGEVPIRDNIAGPLRATLPFAGENGVLAPTDPNYILVKVFGVTDGGSVVVVNVRNKDLTQ
ncbi:MAG TPA: hypothetical protein VGC44_04555 [Longimicrobiales bacterium]